MENTLFLGEIEAQKFETRCTCDNVKLKLFITRIEVANKSILSVEDENGEKFQVEVCREDGRSFYVVKNGNVYRYIAGSYYIESLNIAGFEISDIPLFKK